MVWNKAFTDFWHIRVGILHWKMPCRSRVSSAEMEVRSQWYAFPIREWKQVEHDFVHKIISGNTAGIFCAFPILHCCQTSVVLIASVFRIHQVYYSVRGEIRMVAFFCQYGNPYRVFSLPTA